MVVITAAIAVTLARRGHLVHLSTTDPAAHVAQTLAGQVDGLTVSRIDPMVETAAYQAEVLHAQGPALDEAGRALLEEDLRSPRLKGRLLRKIQKDLELYKETV